MSLLLDSPHPTNIREPLKPARGQQWRRWRGREGDRLQGFHTAILVEEIDKVLGRTTFAIDRSLLQYGNPGHDRVSATGTRESGKLAGDRG